MILNSFLLLIAQEINTISEGSSDHFAPLHADNLLGHVIRHSLYIGKPIVSVFPDLVTEGTQNFQFCRLHSILLRIAETNFISEVCILLRSFWVGMQFSEPYKNTVGTAMTL